VSSNKSEVFLKTFLKIFMENFYNPWKIFTIMEENRSGAEIQQAPSYLTSPSPLLPPEEKMNGRGRTGWLHP
jgi:hypothetical protein